jgi:hypothetical protein
MDLAPLSYMTVELALTSYGRSYRQHITKSGANLVKSKGVRLSEPGHRSGAYQNRTLFVRIMKQATKEFVSCVDDIDYKASLILGKVYPVMPDTRAAKDELVRIVDESGEDYLYDKSHFVSVEFSTAVRKKLLALRSS